MIVVSLCKCEIVPLRHENVNKSEEVGEGSVSTIPSALSLESGGSKSFPPDFGAEPKPSETQ